MFALLAVGATLVWTSPARADEPVITHDPGAPQPPAGPPASLPLAAPPPPPTPPAAPPPGDACTANPCEKDCACATRCCAKACPCDKTPKVSLSVSGVRASLTNVSTGTIKDSAVGVALAGAADTYALDGTTHAAMYFVLGGGEAGFEGALAGTLDFGYRLPVAEDHGPFGRIGFDGRLQGNDLLYFSILELPRVSLGYQYLKGKTVVEIGGRGGAVLAGLYDPGEDGRRKLGGFEWGAFASAQVDFLRLDVSAMRIEARKTLDGTPVDVGRAAICGVGGKVGVCLDGMLFHGNADMRANDGGIHSTTSTYLGLTLGVAGW